MLRGEDRGRRAAFPATKWVRIRSILSEHKRWREYEPTSDPLGISWMSQEYAQIHLRDNFSLLQIGSSFKLMLLASSLYDRSVLQTGSGFVLEGRIRVNSTRQPTLIYSDST